MVRQHTVRADGGDTGRVHDGHLPWHREVVDGADPVEAVGQVAGGGTCNPSSSSARSRCPRPAMLPAVSRPTRLWFQSPPHTRAPRGRAESRVSRTAAVRTAWVPSPHGTGPQERHGRIVLQNVTPSTTPAALAVCGSGSAVSADRENTPAQRRPGGHLPRREMHLVAGGGRHPRAPQSATRRHSPEPSAAHNGPATKPDRRDSTSQCAPSKDHPSNLRAWCAG